MTVLDDRAKAARDLFARNMRRLRRGLGLSQETLGVESGLTQSYVSGVEAGKRNPSLDAIGTIAAAMGIPMAKLFEEEPPSVAAKAADRDGRDGPSRA